MKRIGVLTSGGDAPGMNAAIRAVTRAGIARGWEVFGVRDGFAGLIDGRAARLGPRAVGGILAHGGTMLGSARCDAFRSPAGREGASREAARLGLDGLVIIGGGGSQTGAHALSGLGLPVVGVASTIDNDLVGSDLTLGVQTALDVALESIDRLRVTASSHRRAFVVEVMGRDCGYLALVAGIAGGAEVVAIPEVETAPEAVAEELHAAWGRGKSHAIVVVAEGARRDATAIGEYFAAHREALGFEHRVTILGHVQRGGAPCAFDRLLATRLGAAAVDALADGDHDVLVGTVGGRIQRTPLADVVGRKKPLDPGLLEIARVMAA
ncbi:MAG: ATP-dependent 6-phosphofructokinase [Myxococcota bacterium]